jgi:hypothetical protein
VDPAELVFAEAVQFLLDEAATAEEIRENEREERALWAQTSPRKSRRSIRHRSGTTGDLLCAKDLHWIDLCRTPCRDCRSSRTDEQEEERRRADGEWIKRLHSEQEGSNGMSCGQ